MNIRRDILAKKGAVKRRRRLGPPRYFVLSVTASKTGELIAKVTVPVSTTRSLRVNILTEETVKEPPSSQPSDQTPSQD